MMLKKIKDFFYNYYLIFLGFVAIAIYLRNRFFTVRISKTLPFDLPVLRFFIFISLCCVFLYIIFTLIYSPKKNILMENFIDWLFTPIKKLEKYIRHKSFLKLYYQHFIKFMIPILEYSIINTNLFYLIFWVFPRLVLLTALFIDVFIFNQFHYKYQVILFGLLLFLNRCVKYTLKNIKEEKIQHLSTYIVGIVTEYVFGIHPSEWPENYNPDDDDDNPPTMCLPLDVFIKFKTESLVYENISRNITLFSFTHKIKEEFWQKYIGEKYVCYSYYKPVPENYTNIFGNQAPKNYYEAEDLVLKKKQEFATLEVENIMQLSLLLEYLNKTSNSNKKFKNMKILIYLNYLLCWLYVLIVSLPNLHVDELIIALIYTWLNIVEPFSELNIFAD